MSCMNPLLLFSTEYGFFSSSTEYGFFPLAGVCFVSFFVSYFRLILVLVSPPPFLFESQRLWDVRMQPHNTNAARRRKGNQDEGSTRGQKSKTGQGQ